MRVLFVCKYNSGRSQMAKGFLSTLSKKHYASSAGTHAAECMGKPIPDYVIRYMNAVGIDVSGYQRSQLTPKMVEKSDKVVMITARKDWPEYVKNSPKVVFWDVEDAKDQSYEFHCKIRDQIKELAKNLIRGLDG